MAAAATLLGLVASACGSSTTSGTATTATSVHASGSSSTSSSGSTTSGAAEPIDEVTTGTVSGLGTVLVDGQGFTLYLFEPDQRSGNSTCYNACAQAWPPLLVPAGSSAPVAGPGIQASLLGTTKRTDGTVQVTYNKWPLYLWVSDSEPGQATGQAIDNLGGLWYVLSPSGNAITTKP